MQGAKMRAHFAIVTAAILLTATSGADARSVGHLKAPREIPPSSYKANQYVDSAGCVFIRSGYGGTVSWVARVARNRTQICGMKPNKIAGATKPVKIHANTPAEEAARRVALSPQGAKPVAVPTVASAPVKKARPPKIVSAVAWRAFWFGTSRVKTTTPVRTQPVAVVPQRVVVQQPRQVRTASVSLFGGNSSGRWAVRTVPQAIHPSYWAHQQQAGAGPVEVTRSAVATEAVVYARAENTVPKGYKTLVPEGTYPETRGVGTAQGQAAMDLLWTRQTPRRLIDVTTGHDVTATYPQIRWPYTTVSSRSYAAATPAGYTYTGKTRARSKSAPDAASPLNMKRIKHIEDTVAEIPQPVQTSRVTGRFIQVATFGVPANATRTQTRFDQAGLPTAARALRRGGRNYSVVLLGPFQDQAGLQQALNTARQSGFGDAFAVD